MQGVAPQQIGQSVMYCVHCLRWGRGAIRRSFLSAPLQGPCPFSSPCLPCLHAQPNLVEAALFLLPVRTLSRTSPPSASPPAQHSTAPHGAAPSLAALSPPMMLPPLSSPSPTLLLPPMLPVPVSPRALAPRGLGLSTRPSWCRRRNRVFYSRNPHCDGGLVQRS